ncbi:hypothetical protein TRAPUB_12797 [Trametes pubescens]|uniref:Uncharacterized protein n=1 Tax=Trametes pubescens TaxID=154538 RepID=A0A1M2VSY9_TRAPU|nr:hypothetical protein TRAPUB_12797 [Trametes pubescens]
MPVPTHLADPTTPPKPKGKFSFLARKRKPSAASPASARTATEAAQRDKKNEGLPPVPSIGASPSHLPPAGSAAGASSQNATPASLPPLNVSPPSLGLPQLEGESSKIATPPRSGTHQRIPSGIPTATLRNLRTQKSTSFEHSRRSNDSHGRKQSSSSSSRPIITISPPHNVAEGTDSFHAPRSAPRPPSHLASRQPRESGLPTPSPSTATDRTGPDSPTSDAGSMTSVQSSMQFPIPSVDGPQGASSYKEESLLRRDHFEIGPSESAGQRRGTVSGSNQGALGSMGRTFMQERQQRRHVSVLHFNTKPKQEPKQEAVSATFPRVRRSGAHSDSPSTSGQSGNESTASSHGTVSALLRSKTTVVPASKKVPPPLLRTWHTPPSTGPPTEPLPSPPSSAPLQPLLLSSTSRTSGFSASSPPSPQKTLPPLPPTSPTAPTESARSSGSLGEAPPSPARSERATSPLHTPMRQDAVKKVLEDENASADELREALRTQTAKYSRLMAYLLTLTERHGMEKHEFLRRIETFEQDARRRERELKGLRWLVANSSQSGAAQGPQGQGERREGAPARADSSTLPGREPRGRQRSCSESVASPQTYLNMGFDSSPETGASPTAVRSAATGVLDSVRMSIDSPTGSTEEGLYEMQTTISQFIAPNATSPPTINQESQDAAVGRAGMSPTARLKRSNTLPGPDALAHLPVGSSKQKQARRTSSPVLPVSNNGSPATNVGSGTLTTRSSVKAGLGIGIDLSASRPSSPGAERDPHARSDSSTLSSSTLSSLPSLSTLSSALSSIPETPRMDAEFPLPKLTKRSEEDLGRPRTFHRRLSGSSLSSSTSSGTGTGSYTTSSRVSASPSIGQILDRSKQPEMDAILRKLRAYGHGSP